MDLNIVLAVICGAAAFVFNRKKKISYCKYE